MAAPVFDQVITGGATVAATTTTITLPAGASNRDVIACIAVPTSTPTCTATCGGTAMTQVGRVNGSGTDQFVAMFRLTGVGSGSQSIVFTLNSSQVSQAYAVSFTGVTGLGTVKTFDGLSGDATVTMTDTDANSATVDIVGEFLFGANTPTMTGLVRTQRVNTSTGSIRAAGSTGTATGASTTQGWSQGGAGNSISYIAVPLFGAAVAADTVSMKSNRGWGHGPWRGPSRGFEQTRLLRTAEPAAGQVVTVNQAVESDRADLSVMRALIPGYIFPGAEWDTVIADPKPVAYWVANPASGPGASADPSYVAKIAAMQAAGVTVLGYSDTNFTAVTAATVKADIDAWQSFYAVDGIFFDRASALAADIPYYADLRDYVAQAMPASKKRVVLNHGTEPDQGYLSICDVTVTFEGDGPAYAAATFPSWQNNYPKRKFSHLVYNDSGTWATNLALARSRPVGFFYSTDDVLVNPWDTLPTDWANESAALNDQPLGDGTITTLKTRTIGQATETDTARPVTRSKTRTVGQATETDTAQPIARLKTRVLGQAVETDTARPITHPGQTVAVGQAIETDTARPITRLKTRTVGQAIETDTAQPITRLKRKTLGQALETSVAQAITRLKTRVLGQSSETDTARPITRLKTRITGQATETDTARPITRLKTRTLGQAIESSIARAITRLKRLVLGQPAETDTARTITPIGGAGSFLPVETPPTFLSITARPTTLSITPQPTTLAATGHDAHLAVTPHPTTLAATDHVAHLAATDHDADLAVTDHDADLGLSGG